MHASRTPRRAFAAPLVLTIAALPACLVASAPPKTGEMNPPPPNRVNDPATTTTTISNPPRPDHVDHTGTAEPPTTMTAPPVAKAPDHERTWTVMVGSDGSCSAQAESSCPANARCNPPPPTPVACPSGITAAKPVQIWARANSNECLVVVAAAKCPAKATCNPPPPQKTACPQ